MRYCRYIVEARIGPGWGSPHFSWIDEFWFPEQTHPRDIREMISQLENEGMDRCQSTGEDYACFRDSKMDPTRYTEVPEGARMIEFDEARTR